MITIPNDIRVKFAGIHFVDLCCGGIGGFHVALKSCGANCVYAADIEPECRRMYARNFGIKPAGDLTKVDVRSVPHHDILTCGLPCQSWSSSGLRAGFDDDRGRLFREVLRIIAFHKPQVVLIENVGRLATADGGRSFAMLKLCLQKLEYVPSSEILCAGVYGVPQARQRLYLVALRRNLGKAPFQFPLATMQPVRLRDVLLPARDTKAYELDAEGLDVRLYPYESISFRPGHAARIGHYGAGRQSQKIYHAGGQARTIMSTSWGRVGNLAGRTGLYLVGDKIRCLAPREVARCFGLPENFILHEDDETAVQHLGNSVVVDVVQRIAIALAEQGVLASENPSKNCTAAGRVRR